ncbi:MAG TPA: esterase-like activity of phytase family protein, partial [Verrucomicrobiae bacterium]|nr:esterase-like activity of phytase family protein [Verrucomicrobiae bacterium]
RPQDLKISAAACVTDHKLLLLERSDEVLGGQNIGGAKLVLVDLENASDISNLPQAATLALEDSSLDLASLQIVPASSKVVYSNEETPQITDFKLEGLSILNRNEVAISNDNDFGVEAPLSFKLWVIRLSEALPTN